MASASLNERLVDLRREAQAAPHGQRGAIYDRAATELGMSRATLLRKLSEATVAAPRRRRADRDSTGVTRDEADMVSALMMEGYRKNGKRIMSLTDAVAILRANDAVRCEHVNTSTGEVRPLSDDAISRALYLYGVHPQQLTAPAPVTELASRHANHVWQLDASVCTLWYLGNGLKGMAEHIYYKNKPENLERISANRVWRYVVTDHASGWIYVEYVLGAESAQNMCNVLINAMQYRGGQDMMHGRPLMLMVDPGSGNKAGMARNLCRSLGTVLHINKPGNPRAKGQVENAQNLVETRFEAGLALTTVNGLEELNALAAHWRSHFNSSATHGRHGLTRSQAWMRIQGGELVKAPPLELCRELAVATPEERKVTPKLRVSFRGDEYDVSQIPGVLVGQTLMLTQNPWREDAAQVVLVGDDGLDEIHVVNRVARNDWGFATGAAIIGEEHKRHADTPAQIAAKKIEKLAMGAGTEDELAAKRKAKVLPFGGQIDPYKHLDTTNLPTPLPRRGQEHPLTAARLVLPPINHAEAAKRLRSAWGAEWSREHYAWLVSRWPEGVPQDALERLEQAPLTVEAAHAWA